MGGIDWQGRLGDRGPGGVLTVTCGDGPVAFRVGEGVDPVLGQQVE